MKTKFFIVLLFVAAAVAFGLYINREPGFAVFTYADTTVEMQLVRFYAAVVVGLIALYILVRLIIKIVTWPCRFAEAHKQKQQRKATLAIQEAILETAQNRWQAASHVINKSISYSPVPALQHYVAAKIAQRAGMSKQRDQHLSQWQEQDPQTAAYAQLLHAELLLEDGDIDKAIDILEHCEEQTPGVTSAMVAAYTASNQAEKLAPALEKLDSEVGTSPLIHQRISAAVKCLAESYVSTQQYGKLNALWTNFSAYIHSDQSFLLDYLHNLRNCQQFAQAEQIIAQQLNQQWDEQLVQEYGLLGGDQNDQHIKQAEKWLQSHSASPGLLLTLGRLYKQAKLWGKAKGYLESSLKEKALPATYAELAEVYTQLDENEKAKQCSQLGLKLAVETVG